MDNRKLTIRYAIALVLVSWYLMEPPALPKGINLHAPLSSWDIIGSYDAALDCSLARQRYVDAHSIRNQKERNDQVSVWMATQAVFSKCIATDDPRLKP